MSYASKKGWDGQQELKEFLEKTFSEWGFKFHNVVGSEKNKKALAGDVVLDEKTDLYKACVLRHYLWDAKKKANPQFFPAMSKAEDDAVSWGKWGAILYVVKQAKGSKGERLICMKPKTFQKLVQDLQRSSVENK